MDIEFEKRIQTLAGGLEYPPNPDITGAVMLRLRLQKRRRIFPKRLAWSLIILLVLVSSIWFIPTVRAAIIEFFQVGTVRIFPQTEETEVQSSSGVELPKTATPGTVSSLNSSLLDTIAGETNLAKAQEAASYPLLLPTHPPMLGLPDHVYMQDAEGTMVILVWVDPQQPERAALSLHFIPTGSWAINKMGPTVIQETQVNSQYAIWAEGTYPLFMRNGSMEIVRLIDGHVLIWARGDITYRLETDFSLEEAITIAESLEPIP